MINYSWELLELFSNADKLISVRYLLIANDGVNTIKSEGNHVFSDGLVNKPLSSIVESDIVQWLEKDTFVDEVNPIKLNLEYQLSNIQKNNKTDFPWLANTFTID